jgi:hypothetical protein
LAHLKSWFDAILESRAFDAIDIHDYFLPEPGNSWGLTFAEYIQETKRWMSEKGVSVPLWITEFDYSSDTLTVERKDVPFTVDQQAQFLEKAIR